MEDIPEIYTISEGEVASVTEYGAFIKIPGCKRQGLVHKSQMSAGRVDNPSEIVDVGERVWVKVIGKEVKDGKVKISLSMKCVNQGSGMDIDPNNVALDQDERRKRTFKDFTTQRITLEAVLNTLCKKCGCKVNTPCRELVKALIERKTQFNLSLPLEEDNNRIVNHWLKHNARHFAKDCFMQPGGVKYSLIPDEEVELANCSSQPECQPPKKKKKVKEKEQKKSKEKKTSSKSSSDTSDTNSDQDRADIQKHKHSKKTQKSHKKKHKKHKHKRSKKKE